MGLSVKDFGRCCRCCLVVVGEMKPLFGACLNVMLMKLMDLQVTPTDGFPQQMCIRCVLKLSSAYTFYITVSKNQKTLDEILKEAVKSGELPEIPSCDEKKELNMSSTDTLKEESSECKVVCTQPFNAPKESTIPQPIHTPNSNMSRRVNYEQPDCDSEESTGNEESYQCSQCNHSSKDEEDLQTHLQTHLCAKRECNSGAEAYTQLCNICGALLRRRTSLHKHLRAHAARRRCPLCTKTFAEVSSFKLHLVSHGSVPKPFRCGECARAFTQRAARDRHARRHPRPPRLPCDQCDKTFLYKYSLHRHRESAHSIHECTVCNKLFNGKTLHDMHMRYHKKENMALMECSNMEKPIDNYSKPTESVDIQTVTVEFLCLLCTTKFQTRESLEVHTCTKENIT